MFTSVPGRAAIAYIKAENNDSIDQEMAHCLPLH